MKCWFYWTKPHKLKKPHGFLKTTELLALELPSWFSMCSTTSHEKQQVTKRSGLDLIKDCFANKPIISVPSPSEEKKPSRLKLSILGVDRLEDVQSTWQSKRALASDGAVQSERPAPRAHHSLISAVFKSKYHSSLVDVLLSAILPAQPSADS